METLDDDQCLRGDEATSSTLATAEDVDFSSDGVLCAPCSQIRFHWTAISSHPTILVPRPSHICPMCKLFDWILRGYTEDQEQSANSLSCGRYTGSRLESIFGNTSLDNTPLELYRIPKISYGLPNRNTLREDLRLCVVSRLQPDQQTKFDMQSCSVRAKDIDYNAVRSLIAQCDHEHQAICGVSAKLWTKPLQHFYLIHCESRRIISVHEPCDYVALSYVWGKPENILGISDTQPTFPQTIKDAIKVTTQLGFSYLWVDRYCINQSSEVHKTTQIRQMGQIYSQATLAIIAAAGVNPSYGLPGVSRERIRLPCDVVIGAYRVTPVPDSPKSYIQNSVWATRGWTYQEAYLSRRLLFFTDSQLLFECRGSSYEELEFGKMLRRDLYSSSVIKSKGGQTLKALVDNIDDFSSRELRFVQDRLRAFLGVLAHFSAAPVPIYHIWGVPLVFIRSRDKWELFLHTWEATQSDRNPGYPSWSWLGWTGRISAKNVLDYAFNDYYSVKVEEKNQVVDLSPTLLQQYYSVGNSPEAAPAVLQLESTVFPIYAVKHVQSNPGRKLMELIYDMGRGSFGLVYGYQDLDVIPEMVNEPSWVTWQGRNGKWVYSKYTVLDRTFPGNLTGNEKTKLLAVNIGGRSIFSEVGILRAVGGGYETVGFISLFKGSTILIEVGDGEVPQNKSVDCWAPRMTPDKVRWL